MKFKVLSEFWTKHANKWQGNFNCFCLQPQLLSLFAKKLPIISYYTEILHIYWFLMWVTWIWHNMNLFSSIDYLIVWIMNLLWYICNVCYFVNILSFDRFIFIFWDFSIINNTIIDCLAIGGNSLNKTLKMCLHVLHLIDSIIIEINV